MTGKTAMSGATPSGKPDRSAAGIPPIQIVAATKPDQSTSELVGSFRDFESLFDQLGRPPVIELGKPEPDEKYLPSRSASCCPAEHNRLLIGEED